jgi:hypothetical protein
VVKNIRRQTRRVATGKEQAEEISIFQKVICWHEFFKNVPNV